jgi:hypothetical protein
MGLIRKRSRRPLQCCSFVLIALLAGCGDSSIGKVSGKVTFRGQPVSEGRISFTSKAEGGGGADATLNTDGTYRIVTDDGGLKVGEYEVTVFPAIIHDTSDPHTPPVGVEKPADNIPKKYWNPKTSGFTATVKPGKNTFEFDMQ